MPDQQQDELSPETKELPEEERPRPQRTVDIKPKPQTDIRKTGVADQTDALPTAVPESGSSDQDRRRRQSGT